MGLITVYGVTVARVQRFQASPEDLIAQAVSLDERVLRALLNDRNGSGRDIQWLCTAIE